MPSHQPKDAVVPDEWNQALADAKGRIEELEDALREADRRRATPRKKWALGIMVAALIGVGAWDAWVFTRPPQLPSPEDQAYALRRTAGALAEEVLATHAAEGRWPGTVELAEYLGDGLTYEVEGEGFVVRNTDGEFVVAYDGSAPVEEWVERGGYALTRGDAP